jgi:hypothetical protein
VRRGWARRLRSPESNSAECVQRGFVRLGLSSAVPCSRALGPASRPAGQLSQSSSVGRPGRGRCPRMASSFPAALNRRSRRACWTGGRWPTAERLIRIDRGPQAVVVRTLRQLIARDAIFANRAISPYRVMSFTVARHLPTTVTPNVDPACGNFSTTKLANRNMLAAADNPAACGTIDNSGVGSGWPKWYFDSGRLC